MPNTIMKKVLFIIAVFVAVSSLQSCSEEKYTVWTDTVTYAQFEQSFQTSLEDGYYKKIEITNEQWEQIAPNLTSNEEHRWSESEIKKWLIGYGFDETKATKESSWLVMTKHGFLVTREGNFVHLILK